MLNLIGVLILFLAAVSPSLAGQSVIIDTDGYACMGDDKSRKQTEEFAFKDAKRKATESASTYIQSETRLKDAIMERDLLSAYANAQVKVVQEFLKEWYKDTGLGECYRVTLKVEVLPDEKTMNALARNNTEAVDSDPSAPLSVKVWTDRNEYRQGEKIRVFMKGNRPFFARLVYRDASGALVQILPNPYRKNNYFNGGTIYEVPSGEDRFDLEVSPPFGAEAIMLTAGTNQLGELDLVPSEGVYAVQTAAKDIAVKTRGIKVVAGKGAASGITQFAENEVNLKTVLK